jgi:thiamine-phosphate pyrophosphorylase
MDERLVAWARAVKARQAKISPGRALPVLWLFTDEVRLPDPSDAVARLPRGLCGVVLRHDGVADRAALARRLARLCRARRNLLVVAGDWRLAVALRAGVHLRGGRRQPMSRCLVNTASAHGVAELVAARRAGVALVFLSPAFATLSHPGAAGLAPSSSNRSNAFRNTVWAASSASAAFPSSRTAVAKTMSWYLRTNASNGCGAFTWRENPAGREKFQGSRPLL